MRWSNLFIPTLREEPSQVEAASHRLLLRAGYIRQLTAGVYSLLPLGQRVRLKFAQIIREEMDAIGGQEFLLSALQPMELWEESGRKDTVADVMFRLKDRKSAEMALGLTHEEVFTSIARVGIQSYKQLPQIWYQIQTKFRDEARPKGGLLRVREFTMKDSYSFDIDEVGLDASFNKHHDAYVRIFNRCGLPFTAVQASSGAMGGSASTEFMVLTTAGEDTLVLCTGCDYAANSEKAESAITHEKADPALSDKPVERFDTPGIRTIKELEEFPGGASAQRQIKTLVYVADGKLVLALVQGDQELNESKLQTALSASQIRPAVEDEIMPAMGAQPGSLGAVGIKSGADSKISAIVADNRLRGRVGMVTGANQNDVHVRNVNVERDIAVDVWTDLHTVKAGEPCAKCGGNLQLAKGLEIGHIFKLGTRYSESMSARVLGPDGERRAILMGSYGIGVERLMAAVVELNHDEKGIIWPPAVAPFQLVIVPVNIQDKEQMRVAESIYADAKERGIEVILDDRDERPGVKFADSELIGVPFRVTVGKKVGEGKVEFLDRASGEKSDVAIDKVFEALDHALR